MFKAIALKENGSIPLETEGLQIPQELIAGSDDHARRIDIFYTQQPLSLLRSDIAVAGQRRYQRAEMQSS
jgi:hypothetical protein